MFAYLTILLTALAGFAGAPTWSIIPGAAILTFLSALERRNYLARFNVNGSAGLLSMANWQRAGHSLLASGSAFLIGCVSGAALQFST